MIKKLSYVLTAKDKIYLIYLLILVLLGSMMELLGVSAFMPFIEIITDSDKIYEEYYLNLVYEKLNFRDTYSFLIAAAVAIIFIYIVKNIFLMFEKNTIYKFSYNLQHRLAKNDDFLYA